VIDKLSNQSLITSDLKKKKKLKEKAIAYRACPYPNY